MRLVPDGGETVMGWAGNVFPLLIITASGGFTGLFVYNPAQGHSNLVDSIAATGGTDPYGNVYQAGITSYPGGGSGTGVYSQLSAGTIQIASSAFQSAPVHFTVSGSLGASAGMSITSGVGTEAGATASILELADSGAGTGLQVVDGRDGNIYDTERLTLFLATAFTVNSTTPQAIFTKALGIGTYEVEVWAVVLNNTAADGAGFAFAFTGTATGLMDYEAINTSGGIAYVASNTLTTQGNSFGVAGNQRIEFRMTITVTVAGTLTWTGKELVAANTVSVIQGSRMRICPVRAS